MKDLFGFEQPKNPVYKGRKPKRKNTQANGYAATPGTGPEGETCKTCEHCTLKEYHDKRYYKCELTKNSNGIGTDIRLKSPACLKWVASE